MSVRHPGSKSMQMLQFGYRNKQAPPLPFEHRQQHSADGTNERTRERRRSITTKLRGLYTLQRSRPQRTQSSSLDSLAPSCCCCCRSHPSRPALSTTPLLLHSFFLHSFTPSSPSPSCLRLAGNVQRAQAAGSHSAAVIDDWREAGSLLGERVELRLHSRHRRG